MATKQNPINRASQDLTIDPGASGDSFLQFSINTTGEFRIGVDDDASDAFKISQGSALGTTDTFIMTAAGERTMPLQPAFLAYLGTGDDNQTGNGVIYDLGSGNALTEVFDQNSDFNVNGTFTASITGRYLLSATILVDGLTNAMTNEYIQILTSNRRYIYQHNPWNDNAVGTGASISVTSVTDMDAADTAIVQLRISNGAGDTADIVGDAVVNTYFSGCLLV